MTDYLKNIPLEERIEALPATIERLAAHNSVITLPWVQDKTPFKPAPTFDSSKSRDGDPWMRLSPFDKSSISNQTLKLSFNTARGSFKSIESSAASSKEEHVSMSFSLSAGCALLKASVSGQFDKDVVDNQAERKLSKHATMRYGTIYLEEQPRLAADAYNLLHEPDGWDDFQRLYGNYWVVGYNLGIDTTVLLSENKNYSKFSNYEQLSVQVKVVGIKHENKTHEFVQKMSFSSAWEMSAFDSLTQSYEKRNVLPDKVEEALQVLSLFDQANRNAERISDRVGSVLRELNLDSSQDLTQDDLVRIGKAGFIVEVVLRPLLHHREVRNALAEASLPPRVLQPPG